MAEPSETSTREAILDVAEALMTTVGYDKTSIARICRESGLTVGSLYHHFGSKVGLLTEVMKRVEQRFFQGLPVVGNSADDPDQGLQEFWSASVDGIIANYPYFTLDVELVRLSNSDSDLRRIVDAHTVASHELLANALIPYARMVRASDPDQVAHRLASIIVTFTRGAIVFSGSDLTILRQEMDRLYTVVHDGIVRAGRSGAGDLVDAV